jgi:hypothetical protein
MKKRKQIVSYQNKKEMFYHGINALLSGALVLLGSLTTSGEISLKTLSFAIAAALFVAVTKFKDYFSTQEKEYSSASKVFSFVTP